MWTFIDLFYREQLPEFTRYADADFLEGMAGEIESDEALAEAKGVESTPSS